MLLAICTLVWMNWGGHGKPLQYSCLENPVNRRAWRATIHRVTKGQTWLKGLSTHARTNELQFCFQFSSAAQSCPTLQPHGLQHTRLPFHHQLPSVQFSSATQFSSAAQSCPTLCDPMNRSTPGLPVHHQLPDFTQTQVHRAISSSVVPFSSCPQSLPASESFPVSQLFPWGGQSTGVSALTSVLRKKSQGWSPSEWTGSPKRLDCWMLILQKLLTLGYTH